MNPSSKWRTLCQLAYLESNADNLPRMLHEAGAALIERQSADDLTITESAEIKRAFKKLKKREIEVSKQQ